MSLLVIFECFVSSAFEYVVGDILYCSRCIWKPFMCIRALQVYRYQITIEEMLHDLISISFFRGFRFGSRYFISCYGKFTILPNRAIYAYTGLWLGSYMYMVTFESCLFSDMILQFSSKNRPLTLFPFLFQCILANRQSIYLDQDLIRCFVSSCFIPLRWS